VGEVWALLDANWSQQWIRYSGFDMKLKAVTVESGLPRPGPIDNSRLACIYPNASRYFDVLCG
jgi:ribulose bisphosphate carboxylase small subunit